MVAKVGEGMEEAGEMVAKVGGGMEEAEEMAKMLVKEVQKVEIGCSSAPVEEDI